jgi:hypothetical protein
VVRIYCRGCLRLVDGILQGWLLLVNIDKSTLIQARIRAYIVPADQDLYLPNAFFYADGRFLIVVITGFFVSWGYMHRKCTEVAKVESWLVM